VGRAPAAAYVEFHISRMMAMSWLCWASSKTSRFPISWP